MTDASGYATTNLQLSSFASDVQVTACVAPANLPCVTFYGTAVPASGLQMQAVAGNSQADLAGQNFQPVIVRVTDFSTPPNPVQAANVVFQSTVELGAGTGLGIFAGDTAITPNPTPIILSSSQTVVTSDGNGLTAFQPTTGGFGGAITVIGYASAGTNNLQFALQSIPGATQ